MWTFGIKIFSKTCLDLLIINRDNSSVCSLSVKSLQICINHMNLETVLTVDISTQNILEEMLMWTFGIKIFSKRCLDLLIMSYLMMSS